MENTLWATAAAIGGSILLLRRATYRMIEVFFVGLIGGTLFTEKPMTGILFTGIASYRMIPQIRAWPLFLGSWMLIPLLWSIRGWIVFGEFAPTKNYAGFIGLCESWTHSLCVSTRYTVSLSYDRLVDSLSHLPEKEGLPAIKELAIQTIIERPLLYLERTFVHALLYWTIPPRYHGNYTLRFLLVRGLPVVILLLIGPWGGYRIWYYRRSLLIAIVGILIYYTVFYSLIHVLNIRYKLDIEWLQLYLCAGVFLPKSPVAASKSGVNAA